MRLQKRTAIVTGAGSGIGRATAVRLAAEGAAVLCADIDGAAALDTVDAISGEGGRAAAATIDVQDPASVDSMIARALEQFGGIDILVNSAGIGRQSPFLEISLEEWLRTVAVNLTGTFLCCQAAARQMVKSGYGRIVNLSSIAGDRGIPGRAAYGASKGGVDTLTRVAAVELSRSGVTVNAVAPGPIETPITRTMHTAATRAAWHGNVPMGRYGEPSEVAAAVVFLASDEATYITGEILHVDGGFDGCGMNFTLKAGS